MAAYTSNAAGSWATSTSWTPAGVPGAGDTVVISHAITITANTTIGDGTATTVLTIGAGGKLTVTGATLTIRGNATLGAYAGGDVKLYLDVANNGATPGGIELDGNTGITPVLNFDYDSMFRIKGTSSAHCFLRTKSGTAGQPGYLLGINDRSGFCDLAYCDVSRIGSAAFEALNLRPMFSGTLPAGYTNAPFLFDHCLFDTCGLLYSVIDTNDGTVNFQFTNCTIQNSVVLTAATLRQGFLGFCFNLATMPLAAGGTRLVQNCWFLDSAPNGLCAPRDTTFQNCYFSQILKPYGDQPNWALMSGCLIRRTDSSPVGIGGPTQNNYFLFAPVGDPTFGMALCDAFSMTISNNVFHYIAAGSSPSLFFGITHSDPSTTRTATVTGNVAIPPQGTTPGRCPLVHTISDDGSAYVGVTNQFIIEHNTVCTFQAPPFQSGNGFGSKAGAVLSLKSNLCVNSGTAGTDNQIFHYYPDEPTHTTNVDIIKVTGGVSQADYNGSVGYLTQTGNVGSVPLGSASGTRYFAPATAVPGTHDVVGGSPAFLDSTRDIAKWGQVVHATDGSLAAALALLQATPSLTGSDLVPWVRAGFAPSNVAYHNTAHDGTDIGAIAYFSSGSATSYTLTGPSSGAVSVASTNFTVTPVGGIFSGNVTPHSTGTGTFSPTFLAFTGSSTPLTFTYTPSSTTGSPHTITTTASPALGTDPTGIAYTVNAGSATSYTLTGPSSGMATVASTNFTVTPVGGNATTTITPHSTGTGTFSPTTLTFSGTSAAQTFTYTPTNTTGSPHTITTTASPTLGTNPTGIAYTVNPFVAAGYTLTGPTKGDITIASTNFTVTPAAPFTGTITITCTGVLSLVINLTFSGTATPQTFTISPNLVGIVTLTPTNSGSLTNPPPVTYLGMVRIGRSGTASSGNFAPSLGGQDLLANGTWLPELKRDITGDAVDPGSAALIAQFGSDNIHVDFSATGAGGGNGLYGIPFNVVPGTQALVPMTYTAYPAASPPTNASPSDPGPVPIPPVVCAEGYHAVGDTPPPTEATGADQHVIVAVRDETTGLVATLWEFEDAWSTNGGTSWNSHGGCKFNIATGAQRPDDVTTAEAAGMAILPILLRYDEVAAVITGTKPDLGHAIRATFPFAYGKYVWPAKMTPGGASTNMAMGGRMRLSASWYAANAATYSGQARVIVDAMRKYGLIDADITGFGYGSGPFVCGISDDRWDSDATTHGIQAIGNIPVTAFEMVKYIPGWTHTGPTSGPVGTPQTFTVARNPAGAANYNANIYLSLNGSTPGSSYNKTAIPLNDASPSGTYTFTPAFSGTYTLDGAPGGQEWMPPAPILFTTGTGGPAVTASHSTLMVRASSGGLGTPLGAPSATRFQIGAGSCTVGCFVRLTTTPGGLQALMGKWNNAVAPAGSEWMVYWANSTGAYSFAVQDVAGIQYTAQGSRAVTAGIWHFVVGIYDRTAGTATIYLDTAADASVPVATFPQNGTTNFLLGSAVSSATYSLDGNIAMAFKYSFALTGAQLVYLYNGGFGRSSAEILAQTGLTTPDFLYGFDNASNLGADSSVNNLQLNPTTASASTQDAGPVPGTPTLATFGGPSTGTVGITSAPFTITLNLPAGSGGAGITLSDGSAGGTFAGSGVAGSTLTIPSGQTVGTFTYTPAGVGAKVLTPTSSGVTFTPTTLTYTASATAATAYVLTAPSPASGTVGVPSGNFTLQANGTPGSTLVVTPSDSGGSGTFTPATVSIADGAIHTFTYTPASTGAKVISVTHTGGSGISGDPSPVGYTSNPTISTPTTTTWQTGVFDVFATGLVGGISPGFGYRIGLNGGAFGPMVTSGIVEDSPGSYSSQVTVAGSSLPRFRWTDGTGGDVTDYNPLSLSFPNPLPPGCINLAAFNADTKADGTMRSASSATLVHFDPLDVRANTFSGTFGTPMMISVTSGTGTPQLIPIASVSGASGAKDGAVVGSYQISPLLDTTSRYYWTDVPAGANVTSWMGATPAPMIAGAVLSLPPAGTVVSGSGSTLVITGYPSGRVYNGQHIYHVPSNESRVILSYTYASPNYTLTISGTFSAVAPGDAVCLLS